MFCFSLSSFCQQKVPGASLFLHEASANKPIQVKQYHGRHELERRKCCLEVGWGQGRERGEGFGDVWREKGGQSVANEAEDQREPRRALTWNRTFGPK